MIKLIKFEIYTDLLDITTKQNTLVDEEKNNGNQNFPELINRNWFEIWQLNRRSDWCAGKLAGGGDSVSSHQGAPRSSPNGNVFTGQFAGSGLSAGTPLRGTISIKLSSQLHATDAASSLADADDSEETGTSLQRSSVGSSPDSSSSDAQVNITARVCGGGGGYHHVWNDDVRWTTKLPHLSAIV